ncbi:hypothetical protein MANES_17G095550v8 [Manihot esculenta]|uniref:Uncharacterized protein n=1 Tax=Manihot esculenta TaxID=3983 RepID=A0ACB7G545_MANES|nr:hypothetical protein MANES_17G095550v8 [Manihot esculenta]
MRRWRRRQLLLRVLFEAGNCLLDIRVGLVSDFPEHLMRARSPDGLTSW